MTYSEIYQSRGRKIYIDKYYINTHEKNIYFNTFGVV